MPKYSIKHVWFDFSGTLVTLKKERHDRLKHETYSKVVGRPVSQELIAEYEKLLKKFEGSNAFVFKTLGKHSGFWSEQVALVEPRELYSLAGKNVPEVLERLSEKVPISLFSNIDVGKILPAVGINPRLFTHIISSSMLKEPKPALEGFHKMVELSGVSAKEILYLGDHVGKDVRPANKVGVKTGLMWGKSHEADYSFEKFEDLLKIF